MPLLAYNLTIAAVTLAAGTPAVVVPASAVLGTKGVPVNVTGELRPNLTVDPVNGKTGGLTAGDFALIQVQVAAGSIVFMWTGVPEYEVATLAVADVPQTETVAFRAMTHLVPFGDTALLAANGGTPNNATDLYINVSAGAALVNGVYFRSGALTDVHLLGVGNWAKSWKLDGTAAVALTDLNDYDIVLCLVNVAGTPAMYAVFGAEAPTGTSVEPSDREVAAALTAAGVHGDGLIISRFVAARNGAAVIYAHVDPASNDALASNRAIGFLLNT